MLDSRWLGSPSPPPPALDRRPRASVRAARLAVQGGVLPVEVTGKAGSRDVIKQVGETLRLLDFLYAKFLENPQLKLGFERFSTRGTLPSCSMFSARAHWWFCA